MIHVLGAVTLLLTKEASGSSLFFFFFFKQNNILCILHLVSALLKTSTLVTSPHPTTKGDFPEDYWRKTRLHVLFAVNTSFNELILYTEFQASGLL